MSGEAETWEKKVNGDGSSWWVDRPTPDRPDGYWWHSVAECTEEADADMIIADHALASSAREAVEALEQAYKRYLSSTPQGPEIYLAQAVHEALEALDRRVKP